DDGDALLVGNEDSPDSLANAIPDAVFEAERGGNFDKDRVQVAPVSFFDRRLPGPAGRGQEPALPPAIPPAHDLEPAVTPDRQPRLAVAIEKANLPLASTLESAAVQCMTPDQLRGQLAPCQGDSDAHVSGSETY